MSPLPTTKTVDGWSWELDDELVDVHPAPNWLPGHVVLELATKPPEGAFTPEVRP